MPSKKGKRKKPRKHTVHTRHSRYHVKSYSRGSGKARSTQIRITASKSLFSKAKKRDRKPDKEGAKTTNLSIKALKPFLKNIPKQDKDLYRELFIGEKHPWRSTPSGMWLAISLPGGELWLRRSPTKTDQITIVHEYGHYAWNFNINDHMKRVFKKQYLEAEKYAEKRAKKSEGKVFYPYRTWKDYFLAGRAGRNIPEAFAEAYAWYYVPYPTRHNESYRSLMKEKRPEMYKAIKTIEKMRGEI